MQSLLRSAFSALPVAASSGLAMVGYAFTITAWTVVAFRIKRNRQLLATLDKFPKKDRLAALQLEMGAAKLKSGLSPEQYLRSRIHLYYLIGFAVLCVLVVLLFAIAAGKSGKKEGTASVDITLSPEKFVNPETAPTDSIRIGVASHTPKDSSLEAERRKDSALSTVRYVYERTGNDMVIKPVVPYLSWLQNGGVIEGSGVALNRVYPELSIKVVNNTDETIYLTEVVVRVNASAIDKEPLLGVGTETWNDLHIENEGYGDVISPKLYFGVGQAKDCKKVDPRTAPVKEQLLLNTFSSWTSVSMKPFVYVPPLREERGNTVILRSTSKTHACVYGRIQYGTGDSGFRAVNFKTTIWVGTHDDVERYKVSVPSSAAYELKLETETGLVLTAGEQYTKRIPISQSIKPGEVDNFTILVVPDKSSRFDLSFDFHTAAGEVLRSRDVILNTIVPRYWPTYQVEEIQQLK